MARPSRLRRYSCASTLLSLAVATATMTAAPAARAQAQADGTASTAAPATPASPDAAKTGTPAPKAEDPTKSSTPTLTPGGAAIPQDADPTKKKEKADRKRAVYVSFDLGFTRPDLGGFSNSLDFDKTAANGLTYSLGAGLRFGDLRFGARWRVYDTTEFNLWGFMGEVGYTMPTRPFSPGLIAHVGYVRDQNLERALYRNSLPPRTVLEPDVDLRGVVVGAEAQAMYWASEFLRAGAYLGFDVLLLSRPQAGLPGSLFPIQDEISQRPLYTQTGSGVGYVINIGVRGAFDIGF